MVDGGCNIRVASWWDLLERAYSGSAYAEGGKQVGMVYAVQGNWLSPLHTRTHATATHSWGIPCLGEGGLLNLRRRNADGPG